jgi:hypothetical protein
MNKRIFALILVLLFGLFGCAGQQYRQTENTGGNLTGLTLDESPTDDDLLYMVNNPLGSPRDRRTNMAAVYGYAKAKLLAESSLEFAGDITIDGSLSVGSSSEISDTAGDMTFVDSNNPGGVTLSTLAAGAGTDDQTAAEVPNTPSGDISATDVQAAINELDTEKQADISFGVGSEAALGYAPDAAGGYASYSGLSSSVPANETDPVYTAANGANIGAKFSGAGTYLKKDGSSGDPSGSGDVTGPGSAVSGNVATFNGTSGKIIQDSGHALSEYQTALIADTDYLTPTTAASTYLGITAKAADADTLDSHDTSYFQTAISFGLGTQAALGYAPDAVGGFQSVLAEGAFVSGDKTKLNGIETGADVTDATNVNNAGAVMETDYNAQTVLAAIVDNTPSTITIDEQKVLGRVTGGDIAALSLGVAASNVAQLPADPGADTLFAFDNTDNTYQNITIGSGLTYTHATHTLSASGGGGYVDVSGTPANHYWTTWVDSDTIKGTAVTASKVVCTDGDGEPTACSNLADVAYESHTSNDFDPDRISGDTVDDNLLSADVITDGSTNAIPTLTQESNWDSAYSAMHAAVSLNASATTAGLSLSTQEISYRAATAGQNGYMTSTYAAKLDGIEASADVTDATNVNAAGAVMETDYNAQTILAAIADNTPSPITIAEQRVLGRVTSGDIAALTLGVAAGNVFQAPADPGANTLLAWDDTDGYYQNITIGSNLTYTHATHTLSATSGGVTPSGSNNQVITDDGASGIVSEANLTFDGSTLAVTGAVTVTTTLGVTGNITTNANILSPNALTIYTTGPSDDIVIDANSGGAADIALGVTGDSDTIHVYGLTTFDTIPVGPASDCTTDYQYANKHYTDSVAGAPNNITPVDTGDEDATFYPVLVDGATGLQATETDGELTYNPSTGIFTTPQISAGAGGFVVDADGDTTVKSLTVSATTTPGSIALDSDAPGTDKEVGRIYWDYINGADGAENADAFWQSMQDGAEVTIFQFDESDDQIETTKAINSSGGFTGNLTGNASGSAGSVAVGSITGAGTGVLTALAVNVGSAGAPVINGGALGTPSSGTLTNCTFPTLNQNTTGNAATATAAASQVITDNAIITADAADIADNDYAKFTANGLEGRSYSEVLSDIGAQAADADLTTWAGITPGANVGTFIATPTISNFFTALTGEATGAGTFLTTATVANLMSLLTDDGAFAATLLGYANAAAVFSGIKQAATTSATGVAELATTAETTTGTDTGRVVTPDGLSGSVYGQKEIGWIVYDSDVDTAVADGKQGAAIPASMNGMNLVDCTCSVSDLNSASGGATTVVLRRVRAGTPQNMTSTGVTISYDAYTASDETVDASYDDVATGDMIYVDVDAVTTGAVQKGLSCTAVFQTP